MKLEVVRFRELSATHRARWAEWQAADAALASPYFHPEFTEAVAAVRDEVFVAVLGDGAGFLPFERGRWGIGRAVGGIISDYHGVIAQPGLAFDPRELVRGCELRAWYFDHLPAAQTAFVNWAAVQTGSPVVDLTQPASGGSAQWREQTARKRRKLAREVGAVEFEMQSMDDAAFAQLLDWKSAQYLASGAPDLFAPGWIRTVVAALRARHGVEFGGIFSVLRAGGRPVAAHFGLRSRGVLHYWFPAYDAALSSYSPGIVLLLDLLEAAPAHGLKVIDFGKGDASYKLRLANARVPLLEGSVVASPWLRAGRNGWATAMGWARRMRRLARGVARGGA